ncbi:MAG TPA: hypothetical protein VHO02_06650 [Fibrobacteria bacterium]|jgi:hypothetical protein|nr:hypothetical protein [Fibrobacteria bacterium]
MRFGPLASLGLTAATLFAFPAAPRAQAGMDPEAPGFQFLKLSLVPRSVAMGGAGAALAEGAGEAEVNPAAAARVPGSLTLGQEYAPREFGARASHLSWGLPWGPRRVVVHARYLGFDEIPGWDADNNSTTPYAAHTLKLQAGMAGGNFGVDWGGSLAYARNNVADASYSAALLNVGARRALPWGLAAGAAATNVSLWSGRSRSAMENAEPASILRGGLAWTRDLRPGSSVSLAADAVKTGEEDVVLPVGVEYKVFDALFLRAGWPVADPDNRLTLGLGLKWSRFAFQYAYKGHSALSGGHGWTLEIGGL